ncbi:MAG: tetratricopeptide repeat protein [Porticoccaceae bacterium]
MKLRNFALLSLTALLFSCANPLNKATYYRYLETGAQAEKQRDAKTAEVAYSRALGNVHIGNLGPEREAEALFNLGRLERLNGKLDLSLEHLLKSLEIDQNINNVSLTFVKSTMGEIAKTYYDMEKYEEGSVYLDRMFKLDEESFRSGQSKRFILRIYSDYAEKFRELGQTEKATRYQAIADS